MIGSPWRATAPSGILTLVTAAAAAATGCGGPADSTGAVAVEAVVAEVDRVLGDLVPDLVRALRLDGARGSRSFTICGDRAAPRGVVVNTFVRFGSSSSDLTRAEATATVAVLLDAAGWTIDDPANRALLTADRGRLELHVTITPSLVQLDLGSACVATPDLVARAYDDRPVADLALSVPDRTGS